MRRAGRLKHDSGPTVSLFPFLAVLLCTMGTLIMLLVLISRNTAGREIGGDPLFSDEALRQLTREESVPFSETRRGAEFERALSSEDEELYVKFKSLYGDVDPDELESQRESAAWFLSELEGVRDRTRDELSAERAKLAEAETEINRLVSELVELNRQAADLSGQESFDSDNDTLQQQIDTKAEEIAALNRQIEGLQRKAAESAEKPTYAILPYRGKSGTFRRPIYVECDGNGIRLMPERVQFVPEDFLVAKYPGNPFDAGLRAARQYYIETGQGNSENEPYPLLILKPESAQTYYIAKSALASWGGEFGYEFVESDAEIEYPRPDPELRRRVEEQVAMARARLAGPIAALLNEMEAHSQEVRLTDPEDVPENRTENGGFASRLGPYARLDAPPTESQRDERSSGLYHGASGKGKGYPNSPSGPAEFSSADVNGSDPFGSDDYLLAPSGKSYAASARSDPSDSNTDIAAAGMSTPLVSDEELGNLPDKEENLTSETAGSEHAVEGQSPSSADGAIPPDSSYENGTETTNEPDAARTGGVAADIAGDVSSEETAGTGNGSTTYAQGDVPYAMPGENGEATPFAEISADDENNSSSVTANGIDPCQTVGNTAFLSGGQGEAGTPVESADAPMMNRQEPSKPEKKEMPKPPGVKAERDKREINLAEELKKPSQTSVERPITVVCGEETVLFPAQAGIRDTKRLDLKTDDDQQAVLETIVACVRGWHAAGRNMYWSPWIRIKTDPGGEVTAERLYRLMRSQRVRVELVGRETP